MLITQIIADYLKTNRRITVGGLGTFLKKQEGEEILFSEFIKDDDGVLHSLLIEGGFKELEAVAVVDRFIFDMKYALTTDGQLSYALPRLGYMSLLGGVLSFEYDPNCGAEAAATPSETEIVEVEPTPEIIQPTPQPITPQPTATPESDRAATSEPIRTANKDLFDSFANYAGEGQNVDLKKSFDKWWIIIPVIAVVFVLVAVFYWLRVEWMYDTMELPKFIDSIFNWLFMNEGGVPGAAQ